VSSQLLNSSRLEPINQWSEQEALIWSAEKYREKYLGITKFGFTAETDKDFTLEQSLEDQIVEDNLVDEPVSHTSHSFSGSIADRVGNAIATSKFLSFTYDGNKTIVQPKKILNNRLSAYCFVKNRDVEYQLQNIRELTIKPSRYTLRVLAPAAGVEGIKRAVNTAIQHKKYIRMKYTRMAWTNMTIDANTGEFTVVDHVEAEESIRTINNIQLAMDVLNEEHVAYYNLDENYINAYCNKREESRTFKFDRISEIEILNL
jgi:predicted DNA-binding transcriptional regulator YafY